MEKYKRKFNEASKRYDPETDLHHLFGKAVDGYGGPGIQDASQYFEFVGKILEYIAKDLKSLEPEDFSKEELKMAKEILSKELGKIKALHFYS